MSKVAVVLGNEFEDAEFSVPRERLRRAGHEVVVIGTTQGETLIGKRGVEEARVDRDAADAYPDDFDAMLIPGGHSPDNLRTDASVVEFVRGFLALHKPVAAICHGPQLLIEADAVKGKTLTSWPSVRKDLVNAGATWVDQAVVEDGWLITSRKPDDLDVFCDAMLEALEHAAAPHSRHAQQSRPMSGSSS